MIGTTCFILFGVLKSPHSQILYMCVYVVMDARPPKHWSRLLDCKSKKINFANTCKQTHADRDSSGDLNTQGIQVSVGLVWRMGNGQSHTWNTDQQPSKQNRNIHRKWQRTRYKKKQDKKKMEANNKLDRFWGNSCLDLTPQRQFSYMVDSEWMQVCDWSY